MARSWQNVIHKIRSFGESFATGYSTFGGGAQSASTTARKTSSAPTQSDSNF